jgi:organic hydroperoxide reductase OsmC/OhrA
MLSFLWVAAQRGFAVVSYEDAALGVMSKDERGREWVTKTTLRPVIRFDGDKRPNESELAALHHEAHDICYIANSVKTEIVVEGRGEGLR